MRLDTDTHIALSLSDIAQWHAAILGMTGSGKTNTLYVFAEELSQEGSKVTIIDPEGDYGSLRSAGALVVGQGRRGNQVDIELDPGSAAAAADILSRHDVPFVVVDLSGFDLDQRDAFVLAYLGQIWRNYQFDDLPVHRLIIDEVQIFAPQGPMTASKKLLLDLAARARKRNLTLALATQRPQSVDKGLLDATRLRIFHRIARGRALKAVRDLLPDTPDAEDVISGLKTGQAILMRDNDAQVVQVRASQIFSPTSAPLVQPQPAFDSAALDTLKELIANTAPADDPADQIIYLDADLIEENLRLKAEIEALRQENVHLNQQLASGFGIQMAPVKLAAPAVQQRDLARQQDANERELKRQQKRFDTILHDIRKAEPRHRRLLSFLVDHEPECFDPEFLARMIGLASPQVRKNPPTQLMKLGLIERDVSSNGNFIYRSRVGEILRQDCPLLDVQSAKEEVAALGE